MRLGVTRFREKEKIKELDWCSPILKILAIPYMVFAFKCRHFHTPFFLAIRKNTSTLVIPIMVFIEDREGIFDAPIDKVWKLAKAHSVEGSKIHPSAKNIETTMSDDNTFINSWYEHIHEQTVKIKMKGTIFYPLGIAFEMIEGPFAGSTYFVYYVPRSDNKTGVVLAGEFRSLSIDPTVGDDERLRSVVSSTLEKVFEEDCAYLKNMP